MRNLLNMHYMVSLHLIIIVGVIIIAAWALHESKASAIAYADETILEQRAYVVSLLETTDNNGADETIATIIADCPNRNEYERKIGALGTLNNRDLITAQQLFENCGSFYAERKALMVSKIKRELEVLKKQIGFMEVINNSDEDARYDLTTLEQLIDMEQKRSDLLTEQTDMQRDIISLLISGDGPQSQAVSDHVARARNINETLNVLNIQIDEMRKGIIN